MGKGRKWEMAFLLTEGIFLKMEWGEGIGRRWSEGTNFELEGK